MNAGQIDNETCQLFDIPDSLLQEQPLYGSFIGGDAQNVDDIIDVEMAVRLNETDKKQISQWIGGRKKYSLLYKASTDGCSATAFHNKCDNKGPTVTVLYNTNNSVYGGYTSLNWNSNGSYNNDSKAFLFRLYQNGKWNPVQMKVNDTTSSTYCHPSYGPTFGAGYDLYTFSGTVNFNGTYFALNGSANFGNSYTMNGEDYNSIANGHLQVKDIEVYLAGDLGAGAPLEVQWRTTPEWNTKFMNNLKEKTEKYKPLEDLKVSQARLLLIGQVGAGKSSFFNTINSIFRGYISNQACAGNAEHSLTTEYRKYQVRNGSFGKPLNFRLHDTRGLEADQGLDSHDICYLLDGHIPDRHQFNPSVPISPDTQGYLKSPSLCDKIHCVVFVLDGSTVDVMPEKVIERIKNLQTRINQRGIPHVVLLTKIDKICEFTRDNVSQVFYSPMIQETVDRVSQMIGLPRSNILPVKNYESEMELNDHINILTLMNLQHMLHCADDYMYNYLDFLEEGKQINIRE